MSAILIAFCLALAATSASAQDARARAELSLEPDQARAVLAILTTRASRSPVPDSLWTRLQDAEGYRRAMERERGMDERFGLDRGINDASFRTWALSDAALTDLDARTTALAAWETVDVDRAGRRALAYLPAGTRIRGTVYPVVREQTNSFIWDLGTDDPAIFMYVEPGRGASEIEDVLAHELHHIGSAMACTRGPDSVSPAEAAARSWIGGFSEGIAVLAAAGGPDNETHPNDPPEVRDAWAARIDSVEYDIAELEDFFAAVLDGRLSGDEAGRRGMTFLNRPGAPQAALYTVGWHMASSIEREKGRQAVIDAVCNPVRLLLDYQEIATLPGSELPTWSPTFLERIRPLDQPSPRSP